MREAYSGARRGKKLLFRTNPNPPGYRDSSSLFSPYLHVLADSFRPPRTLHARNCPPPPHPTPAHMCYGLTPQTDVWCWQMASTPMRNLWCGYSRARRGGATPPPCFSWAPASPPGCTVTAPAARSGAPPPAASSPPHPLSAPFPKLSSPRSLLNCSLCPFARTASPTSSPPSPWSLWHACTRAPVPLVQHGS